MTHRKITKEIWEDATSLWVVVTLWQPKPGRKRQAPTIKVVGDFQTYAKARAVKKRMERATDPQYSPDRRSIFVARKFDVTKLDIFDTYSYDLPKKGES